MSDQVEGVIAHAFNKFVKDDADAVDAADLKACFASHLHPKVISGQQSEDEVFLDFLANFSDRNRDGKVHRDEWNAYWTARASQVPESTHFVELMCKTWKL